MLKSGVFTKLYVFHDLGKINKNVTFVVCIH